ncbi:MAG: hypothetical protein ABR534_00165 [Desulfotignum sp.]|nr:hypothetical protein [Desulfobacteraceae bacterium]
MDNAFKHKNKMAAGIVVVILALVAGYMFLKADTEQMDGKTSVFHDKSTRQDKEIQDTAVENAHKTNTFQTRPKVVEKQIQKKPTIDYNDLKDMENDSQLDQMMQKRLQALGIKESLDMIVRSDESFVLGGKKVSMTDILEKAFVKKNKIFETRITESGETVPERIEEYGIYVVQPGDNIWNIHFTILTEYFASRGVDVTSDADEPLHSGHSSGVGKVLKFSETMVIIYNLIDEQVVADINLLEPLSKIVVYNMGEVFSLLEEINYDTVNQIQFDGSTIWIPHSKT